ncbi:seizure 6-like protein isoform X2 [Pristis pectinata]|uniref:seizure 6-like protein isoform X2 n=1 Tax=Pristis pectinata TaxID=685728 RepID=UPI00223DF806|nr:seizure 6-like protein isoform X2 [Pristis pectinata]
MYNKSKGSGGTSEPRMVSLGAGYSGALWVFLVLLLLGTQAQVQDVGLREGPVTPASTHPSELGQTAQDIEEHQAKQDPTEPPSDDRPEPSLLEAVLQKKDLLRREFLLLPSAIPGGLTMQPLPQRQQLPSARQVEVLRKHLSTRGMSAGVLGTEPGTPPPSSPRVLPPDPTLRSSPAAPQVVKGRLGSGGDLLTVDEGVHRTALAGPTSPPSPGDRQATREPSAHLAPYTMDPTNLISSQPRPQTHSGPSKDVPPEGLDTPFADRQTAPLAAVHPGKISEVGGMEMTTQGGIDTSTTTIVTTTVTTSLPTTVPCSITFSGSEGYIDSTDYLPLSAYGSLQCTFNVTVFMGYGVELQVKTLNLSEGEQLSIRGLEEDSWIVLANQVLLVEGQVIRSPTNTISVYFRSFQYGGIGSFRLHYQIFMLSCNFPRRPDYGDVSVLDLHADGTAHFRCNPGYQLQGLQTLTCMNASQPHWNTKEPSCLALCGGTISNATLGRVLSPNYPANYSNNLTCTWIIEGTKGQKFHMHFEKVSLAGKGDRLIISSGHSASSAVLYDSLRNEYFPLEGLISNGHLVQIEFTSDETATAGGFNIRYEAFERGHCFEPYMQNGNFTTTNPSYNVGAVVEFTCDPGYTMEHGSPIIECIDIREPYWNGTEPLCRALCGGELNTQAGVILSPNWPEPYDEGEDCIWRIHVGEDKRVLLDVQLLNLTNSDILSLYDGDDLTMRILGQFVGTNAPLKVYSTTSDLTVRFHSDPAGLIFGKGQGFIMNYYEVSRNDTCSDLPEIPNGWKTTSHREMVRGTMITYQCDPGYDILGSDTLTCQWDLTWSSDPPFCEKIMYCTDPGDVKHASRTISDTKLLVGSTIQFSCDPGFILDGNALVTCYSRETGTPLWTSKLPHCAPEESVACENPGLPENGYQILYKRLYLPGETLTFMCYEGFELVGEVTIRCIIAHPSHWSGPLPLCKAAQYGFEHSLEAEAAAERPMDGGNMALAIFIPILIISILLGSAYIYVTRCRYHSNLRLPLMSSHPYSQITVETAFDNPIYETGDTREYEVSI